MAKYSVRVEADKEKYPLLLSNGNELSKGELDGGRHCPRTRTATLTLAPTPNPQPQP